LGKAYTYLRSFTTLISMSLSQPPRRLLQIARSACRIYSTRQFSSSTILSTTLPTLTTTLSLSQRRHFSEQPVTATATPPVIPPFEKQTPRIIVYASNVAVITGDNHYGSIADVFDTTWQKSFPDAFASSKAAAELEKGEPIMNAEEQMFEDMKALGLSSDFANTMQIATQADGTTKVMTQAKRVFEAKLAEATGTDTERRNKLIKFTRSAVNKAFGANNEPSFIKDFEFKTNIKVKENNKKFFKKECGVTTRTKIPWYLGGRIDGFHDGKLIEIKNRVSRVFNNIPEYENIQFQCYLQLVNLEHGDLLQRLKSDTTNTNDLSSTIHRDDALFQDIIVPRLQNFCDFLDYFLSNPRFGVEYLLLRRHGQEKFLKDYLHVGGPGEEHTGSYGA